MQTDRPLNKAQPFGNYIQPCKDGLHISVYRDHELRISYSINIPHIHTRVLPHQLSMEHIHSTLKSQSLTYILALAGAEEL